MFPEISVEEIHERVARVWDLDHPVPVPRGALSCGTCGSPIRPRWWSFFHYPYNTPHRIHDRVNVETKCLGCCKLDRFGIPVPRPYFEAGRLLEGPRREVEDRLAVLNLPPIPFPDPPSGPVQIASALGYWNIDGYVPMLRPGTLRCGTCGEPDTLHGRGWRPHLIDDGEDAGVEAVCDVGVKCTVCSVTSNHEVPLPPDVFERIKDHGGNWRQIREKVLDAPS